MLISDWSSDVCSSDLFDSEVFFPGAWDTTVVDGTSYGVPWYVETRVLYYRTDLAEKEGLEAPKTWADLTAFAAGLQAAGAEHGIALQTKGNPTAQIGSAAGRERGCKDGETTGG